MLILVWNSLKRIPFITAAPPLRNNWALQEHWLHYTASRSPCVSVNIAFVPRGSGKKGKGYVIKLYFGSPCLVA